MFVKYNDYNAGETIKQAIQITCLAILYTPIPLNLYYKLIQHSVTVLITSHVPTSRVTPCEEALRTPIREHLIRIVCDFRIPICNPQIGITFPGCQFWPYRRNRVRSAPIES